MSEKLEPCPWCGGKADYNEVAAPSLKTGSGSWTIGCNESGADDHGMCFGYQSLTQFPTKREAREAWNRRAQPIPGAGEGRDKWPICEKCGKIIREDQFIAHYQYDGPAKAFHTACVSAPAPPAPAPVEPRKFGSAGLRGASKQALRDVAPMIAALSAPPPATGEVGALVKEWGGHSHAIRFIGSRATLQAHGDKMASALAEQQREIERLTEHDKNSHAVAVEMVCAVHAEKEAAEAALATAREEIEKWTKATQQGGWIAKQEQIEIAARAFIDDCPVGDDGQPYPCELVPRDKFHALVKLLRDQS